MDMLNIVCFVQPPAAASPPSSIVADHHGRFAAESRKEPQERRIAAQKGYGRARRPSASWPSAR